MDALTSALSNIDFEVVFQLTFLSLIILSGPIVVGLLALRGGDL